MMQLIYLSMVLRSLVFLLVLQRLYLMLLTENLEPSQSLNLSLQIRVELLLLVKQLPQQRLAAGTVISATITGQLTDITINDGGAGYNNDDEITITDSTLQGFGAAATVANTSGDEVTIMTSTNDGNGYQVDDTFTFDNTGTNADVTARS